MVMLTSANLFILIGAVILVSGIMCYLFSFFKQPLIVSYIISGLILRLFGSNFLQHDIITIFSEFGIAFLLFIVGLELNLEKIKEVKNVAIIGGLLSTFAVFIIGFLLYLLYFSELIPALYFGIIFSFSSTMVLIKILSDKRELDTIHARIMIGILILQDIIAIFILAFFENLNNISITVVLIQLLKLFLLLLFTYIFTRYINKRVFEFAARKTELLFIISLSYAFLFGIISSNIGNILGLIINMFNINLSSGIKNVLYSGFSISIGSFLAGFSLANLPYRLEIIGKIKPLRDFFSILFFISLGMQITSLKSNYIGFLIIALIIIFTVKPFINMLTVAIFGFRKRTSFLTGSALIPISEFGLILAYLGLDKGIVNTQFLSLTIYLMIITVIISSYILHYNSKIYHLIRKKLDWLDKIVLNDVETNLQNINKVHKEHIVLCGYNRTGYSLLKKIMELNLDVIVVDYNPEVINKLKRLNVPYIYGDISDPEIIERLNLESAIAVISTVQDLEDNIYLIREVRKRNKKALIFVTSNQIDEAFKLYEEGADYVILPHFLGGDHASIVLEKYINKIDEIINYKISHIKELEHRKKLGHEYY